LIRHDETLLSMAIALRPGIGRITFRRLTERFGRASAILAATDAELLAVEEVDRRTLAALKGPLPLDEAGAELARAARAGVRVLALSDPDYPVLLKNIFDPPAALYVKGSWPKGPEAVPPAVALVGAREATPYGLRVTRALARELASAGLTVVSGLALGVDAAAHEGALEALGRTVAVLGNGLGSVYPPSNRRLAERILAAGGALVSELPMALEARPEHFPARNRIVSGLSRAVVVVEAAAKSGALITADSALEQGRDVFAVPGNIDSRLSEGTNGLLRQGAKPALRAADILEELGIETSPAPVPAAPAGLDPEGRRIWEALSGGAPARHVDELIERTGLAPARAAAALTRLEIKGLVRRRPGPSFEPVQTAPPARGGFAR